MIKIENITSYFINTDGWLYFAIAAMPNIPIYLLSKDEITWRTLIAMALVSLWNGFVAVKAFRSKSKEEKSGTVEPDAIKVDLNTKP